MSKITFFIIMIIIIAFVIFIVSLIAYNKRLDRITRGEARDAHSNVPEPGTTAGVTYKIVLIIIAIVSLLTISHANGMITGMNNTINSLKNEQHLMNMDMIELKQLVEQSNNLVSNLSWEVVGENFEKKTIDLKFSIDLKQYSDNTKVSIGLNDREISLSKTGPGTFTGQVTANLFDFYDQLKVCITENGITKVESTDFYQYLFWNVLPMPSIECNLDSKDFKDKIKCNGWYRLAFDNTEKIKSVSVTYLADGKEIKTFDATAEIKQGKKFELEKDLTVTREFALRIVILTTDGYKIDTRKALVYKASPEFTDQDYENIYDAAGNLIWNNEKYSTY